jgi:hypothetical protein
MPTFKISPNYASLISGVLTVLLLIGYGYIKLPSDIPHQVADDVQSLCMFLGLIAAAFGTASGLWSAPAGGPLASPPTAEEARKIQAQAVQASMAAKQ